MFSTECEERIITTFETRMNTLGMFGREIVDRIAGLEEKVGLLVKYMYGVMPGSDIGNYSVDNFADFAKNGVYLWESSSLVHRDMEEEFLQYTVLYRVNDEEIRPCRTLFYQKIQDRIQGMDEKHAALEINYWCAENATYQSSDDRTLSALAVYETGHGRCGEESTFLTNALRSCGLMARQVYAPRWSHCDDNHAWVEVYIEGKWQFMGACEPEEILNKGWFLSASSRAMVIQSKYFGDTEESIDADGCVKMCSQLERYAHTIRLTVKVIREQQEPVTDAVICGQIINYADIIPVLKVITNKEGKAELSVGRGDLILTVRKGDRKTEQLVKLSEIVEDSACVEIDLSKEQRLPEEFDIIAPEDAPLYTGAVTLDEKETGKKKLAKANEIRKQKHERYQNPEVKRFLSIKDDQESEQIRRKMMELLTDKDRRDLKEGVLEEHLAYALPYVTGHDMDSYILNPRIYNEPLSCYRELIASFFDEACQIEFRENPRLIWKWIEQHIQCDEENEYSVLTTIPAGVLHMGRANALSCRILFVAIARTFGIPARLRVSDNMPVYWNGASFIEVLSNGGKIDTGELVLSRREQENSWNYEGNYSIARLCSTGYQTLHLQQDIKVSDVISCTLSLGKYRLLTSNRLPNGNIFAKLKDFEIVAGKTTELKLELRHADLADMLENITLQPFTLYKKDGSSCDAGELMHGKKKTFFFLEESKEPTEHILNELMERNQEFYKIQEQLIFVLRNIEALKDPNLSRVLREMPDIQIYYDDFSELINKLGRAIYVDPDKLPLIMVTDGYYNSIYGTSGYNVGTADMLYRIMQ